MQNGLEVIQRRLLKGLRSMTLNREGTAREAAFDEFVFTQIIARSNADGFRWRNWACVRIGLFLINCFNQAEREQHVDGFACLHIRQTGYRADVLYSSGCADAG